MSDTKKNMEKRVVSLASSGVIGYYIFSKLNAAQDTVEMPDDGLDLPPALKEATFYEGGIVSVESVKRMSEIIAEQARVYAATIRNGIRTPIVVEQPECAEQENTVEDVNDAVVEESFIETDIENNYDEEDADSVEEFVAEEPLEDDFVTAESEEDFEVGEEPATEQWPVVEEAAENFEETFAEEFAEEEVEVDADADMFANESDIEDNVAGDVEETEPVEETMDASEDKEDASFDTGIQAIIVPVAVIEDVVEEDKVVEDTDIFVAPVIEAPVTFADMGGFENFDAPMPEAPVLADVQETLPDVTLPVTPAMEDSLVEEPVEDVVATSDEDALMENVEPLHKVDEDLRNSETFKSIADFLNTL